LTDFKPLCDAAAPLWRCYRSSGSLEARNALVTYYRPMAKAAALQANSFAAVAAALDVEDLTTEGEIALIDLVERYKPGGPPFYKWASWLLRRRVLGVIRSHSLVKRNGHEAGVELAVESIDKPIDSASDRSSCIRDYLADDPDTVQCERELRAHVLARLPDHLQFFAAMRYWEGWTLDQLAARLGSHRKWAIDTNRECQPGSSGTSCRRKGWRLDRRRRPPHRRAPI
jgi:RNA polymerase sigma factor (sigma-70 family)